VVGVVRVAIMWRNALRTTAQVSFVVLLACLYYIIPSETTRMRGAEVNDSPTANLTESSPVPSAVQVSTETSNATLSAKDGDEVEVLWPVPSNRPVRRTRRPSQQTKRRSLNWTHEACDPASTGSEQLRTQDWGRWRNMKGVSKDCLFSAKGKFDPPLDAAAIRADAAALLQRLAGPEGRACSFANLRDRQAVTWVVSLNNTTNATNNVAPTMTTNMTFAAIDSARLHHRQCDLIDSEDAYGLLVALTAVAQGANGNKSEGYPSIVFAGDSVHRNLMQTAIAMLRGQHATIVDRQTQKTARYVLTAHGDLWTTIVERDKKKRKVQLPPEVRRKLQEVTPEPEVLLELVFAPSFKSPSSVPTLPVPWKSLAETKNFTAIVGGGLLHGELPCPHRYPEFAALARYGDALLKYATEQKPKGQVLILREANRVLHPIPKLGLSAFHDWKAHLYRSVETSAAFHAANALFELDAVEFYDHHDDGMQRVHPELMPHDHTHYTCVARGLYPKPIFEWIFTPTRCHSWHDRAHLEIVATAMLSEALHQLKSS
jgi:hypothetical protein